MEVAELTTRNFLKELEKAQEDHQQILASLDATEKINAARLVSIYLFCQSYHTNLLTDFKLLLAIQYLLLLTENFNFKIVIVLE